MLQLLIVLIGKTLTSGRLAIHSIIDGSTPKPPNPEVIDKCPKEYECPFPRLSSEYTNEHHYLASSKCCQPYRSLRTVNDAQDPMQTYRFPAHQLRFIGPHKVNCDANTELFIAIKSKFSNQVRRQNLRSTWMSKHNCTPVAERNPRFCEWVWRRTKVAFFLSTPLSTENPDNLAVTHEIDTYGDIIQTSFVEHYHNNTLKTVSSMYWAASHCWQAKYVVSIDDDVHLYLPRLWMTIMSAEGDTGSLANWLAAETYPAERSKLSKSDFFSGYMGFNSFVYRDSKWAVSTAAYPSHTWPPYIFGWFVVMSRCVVESVVRAAMCDTLLWIDDVYLYGILGEALSLPRQNVEEISVSINRPAGSPFNGRCDDKILVIIDDGSENQNSWGNCR